jgi:hypothetical protein
VEATLTKMKFNAVVYILSENKRDLAKGYLFTDPIAVKENEHHLELLVKITSTFGKNTVMHSKLGPRHVEVDDVVSVTRTRTEISAILQQPVFEFCWHDGLDKVE